MNKEQELTAALEEEKKARAEQCLAEYNEVLKKYNCSVTAQTIITGSQIESRILIQAN